MDLRPRELILIAGMYSDLVLDLTRAATEGWIDRLVPPG